MIGLAGPALARIEAVDFDISNTALKMP